MWIDQNQVSSCQHVSLATQVIAVVGRDSLRWHYPVQVPRVSSQPAFGTPITTSNIESGCSSVKGRSSDRSRDCVLSTEEHAVVGPSVS